MLTLSQQVCQILSVSQKSEVLEKVLQQVPDLLLIDLQATGHECLQRVAKALMRGAHRHRDQVARDGGEGLRFCYPARILKELSR